MPLAHFTNVHAANNIWAITGDFYYIGPKSEYFTEGEKYCIVTYGSDETGCTLHTDKGNRDRMDVKLKGNFVIWWKYPQYLRKKKLETLCQLAK